MRKTIRDSENLVRYNPGYRKGLDSVQVEEHRACGYTNAAVKPPMKTNLDIIRDNVFTYFNMIFAGLAVLLCIVQSYKSLTFLPVIVCNTIVGIVQEIRSKLILDKMNMLNAPKAQVVRDGRMKQIATEELVLDDIVFFKAGGQICADAYVVHGGIKVNESLLTGEADEITKGPGDKLMSGSFVVSGECYARLDAVGEDSYISRLIVEAKAMGKKEQSEMIRSLNSLVKIVGIIIIPIGIILFVQSFYLNDLTFRESIVSMVAAVIGMIPEGLYLLATVALALSAIRLAGNKVLLHDMKSIETLARVNVLCVDKTGTITENKMVVHGVIALGDDVPDLGGGAGKNTADGTEFIDGLMGDFAAAMPEDNITMSAVKAYFAHGAGRKPRKVIPFSSVCKYSGVVFDDGAYVLGAPEYVLREKYTQYAKEANELAGKGLRTLVLAKYYGEPDGKMLTAPARPVAYINLTNPIRANAAETFSYFAQQGVAIKVISGDNPVTVSRVALEAGIEAAENYVDATTLTDDEDMKKALSKYTVFGRVTPDQKRTFVRLLKELGNTVAMTGDGVNDVLALKDADCSVAMASGSEAAAQSAQVVLLDSDFSRMPQVVLEGRRTVNNIERSASLFLVKNIFSFLLSVLSVAFAVQYPLHPTQVTLISAFTIGIPGFLLALEPNHNIIKGKFIRNVLVRAFPAGLTDMLAVWTVVVAGEILGLPDDEVATVATLILAVVGLTVVAKISMPVNKYRLAILLVNIAGIVFCCVFLSDLFVLEKLSRTSALLFICVAAAACGVFMLLCTAVKKIAGKILGF